MIVTFCRKGRFGGDWVEMFSCLQIKSAIFFFILYFIFSNAITGHEHYDVNVCVSELHGLSFLETSALDSSNVEQAFHTILKGEPACCCTAVISFVTPFDPETLCM